MKDAIKTPDECQGCRHCVIKTVKRKNEDECRYSRCESLGVSLDFYAGIMPPCLGGRYESAHDEADEGDLS